MTIRARDHWHGGRIVTLKREHVCTRRCLRSRTMFGLRFYWCDRYSFVEYVRKVRRA